MLKFIQKWLHNNVLKKYGFDWLYRDILHFRILLTDDGVCWFSELIFQLGTPSMWYECHLD